ncbi:transposase [Dysgonomonas sp. OttesenSCG-928-D17]|nr:transposase [Dysgonomonas sp. OttesenSCG-928-D17]
MAKQIKVIKCPQCGSTQKTQLKEDYYRCNNCGTEYFLDNDDINVNVNHRVSPTANVNTTKIVLGIVGGIVLLFILSLMVSLCSRPKKTTRNYGTYENSPVTAVKENPDAHEDSYSFSSLLAKDGKPVVFSVVERKYGKRGSNKDERDGLYYVFRDLSSDKLLKEEKIGEKSNRSDYKYKHFISTGKSYFILNKRNIYEVRAADLSFTDVTTDVFDGESQFESGIASAEFIPDDRGEGFNVMTNMGKNFYYCPGVKKVYTKDSFYSKSQDMNTLLPGAKDMTYYVFTTNTHDYPEEDLQLLRITYKFNNGGPESKQMRPGWYKHYAHWGLISDNTPYKKQLVRSEIGRVVSYADVTPGRMYFSPSVFYYDDAGILIKFKATAAPDAPASLQLLKTNGEIVWAEAVEESFRIEPDKGGVVKTDNLFVLKIDNGKFLQIGTDGKGKKVI